MRTIATGVWFAAGLFVGMLVLLELGRRLRQRQRARHGESLGEGLGAVQAAVFGLLGLLLAFTFSGAASRFDARRQLVVEEANAIGTTYHRLDLLPPEQRQNLQQGMRDYVDARLALYQAMGFEPDAASVGRRCRTSVGNLAGCRGSGAPRVRAGGRRAGIAGA
jgi:hypothetical protein